ncbi:MAG: hypothetical protein H7832_06215 [Magnetococcus sp. DMHC-6]
MTIDVETWPRAWPLEKNPGFGFDVSHLSGDFERCIVGRVGDRFWGLGYQLERLAAYDLKAVFFVEPLFAGVMGLTYLERIVSLIQQAGQEVQLHPHTEWIPWQKEPFLSSACRSNRLHGFDLETQKKIIQRGVNLLKECGVSRVTAFRAGSFGADNRTLQALAQLEIVCDASYNASYVGHTCRIQTSKRLFWPQWQDGVILFPMGCFVDFPGHLRHLQVTACSLSELTTMLNQAQEAAWPSITLLSHSFELLNRAKTGLDPLVQRRFEGLCRFLAAERGRLSTVGFNDLPLLDPATVVIQPAPLQSHLLRTGWRMVQQVASRAFAL